VTIGKAAGSKKEDPVLRDAKAATDRAKPVNLAAYGELPNIADADGFALDVGGRDVGYGTEDQIRMLIVVADLRAAECAIEMPLDMIALAAGKPRIQLKSIFVARISGSGGIGQVVVPIFGMSGIGSIRSAVAVTTVNADIDTGPVISLLGHDDRRRLQNRVSSSGAN